MHFEPVADDAGVVEQALYILVFVSRYFLDIKVVVGFPEPILFFQDGRPA